jgi:hypothetical protein
MIRMVEGQDCVQQNLHARYGNEAIFVEDELCIGLWVASTSCYRFSGPPISMWSQHIDQGWFLQLLARPIP